MKVNHLLGASAVFCTAMLSGCATPLTAIQENELKAYQAKGLAVEEKNPGAAAGLGILPGGGSFYTRNYGLGIVNLLLWPASVLWDPMSGYDGAKSINYFATKQSVDKAQEKEIKELDYLLQTGQLTQEKYFVQKRDIEKKYSPDM